MCSIKKTHKKKVAYKVAVGKESVQNGDIIATNIQIAKTFITFTVTYNKKEIQLKTPLLGKLTIENVLPGIYIALHLGMNEKQVKEAVSQLQPLPRTMTLHTSIHEVALLDDTFNANPDGVIAAVEYAKQYSGKKILVLEPMIELGEAGKAEHIRVGKAVAHVCDQIFLTKQNFAKEIKQGITDEKGKCMLKVVPPGEIADYVHNHTNKGDIVVFEGREAAVSLNKIV